MTPGLHPDGGHMPADAMYGTMGPVAAGRPPQFCRIHRVNSVPKMSEIGVSQRASSISRCVATNSRKVSLISSPLWMAC